MFARKSCIILWLLCLLSLPGYGAATELALQSDRLARHYAGEEDFRGAVLIAKDGEVLFEQAYGLADNENNVANTLETRFLIGSLTKSFTAVLAMRLVDAGKLQLDTPIRKYIPDLRPDLAEGLTLHLLLKHQSGLPVHLERLTSFEQKDVTPVEILAIINTAERAFTPGEAYQYANLNYHLAAIAIENVTGLSFGDALSHWILHPLGMQDSGVERLQQPADNRARGYRKRFGSIRKDENIPAYALGSGDIYSTVRDLLKWEQALYAGDFLSDQARQQLFAGDTEAFGNYGYGFRVQPYQRGEEATFGILTRHGGSMNGFLANLHRYLDDRLTVIVLGNIRPFPIRQMTFELKELALGKAPGTRSRKPVE